METHPLPQNITSFEDRIIGDITVKQFAFLLVGGITAFLLLITPLPQFLKFFLGGLVAIFSFSMAFLKIEGRSLDIWALNFILAIYSPTQMVWQKKELIPSFLEIKPAPKEKREEIEKKEKTREDFEEMVSFFSPTPEEELLEPEEKTFLSSLDFKVPIETKLLAAVQPEIAPLPTVPSPLPPPLPPSFLPPAPPPFSEERRAKEKIVLKPPPLPPKKWMEEKLKAKRVITPLASEINFLEKPIFRARTPEGKTRFVSALTNIRVSRGLHQLPPSKGTLVLPILGEKKFEVSKELGERLTVAPLPDKEEIKREVAKPEEKITQAEKEKAILQAQLSDLAEELENLRGRLKEFSSKDIAYDEKLEEKLRELEKAKEGKEKALAQVEELKKQIEKERVKKTPLLIPVKPTKVESVEKAKLIIKKVPPKKKERLVITNLPNAINGIVKTPDGSLLENVIVVIKDENENPVRALKTNKLGQFAIATPLPDGTYIIELEKGNYRFDIIELTISGKPVPPVEIQALI